MRLRLLGATILALLVLPCAAAGASAGGTPVPGTSGGPPSASTVVAPTPSAGSSSSSPHVKNVRIQHVSCVPVARCATNPHDVAIHGTLLLAGIGLRAGMLVAFPQSRGARISSASPAARLRQTSIGLLVTVPSSAHSGHIMVLLSHERHTSSFGPIFIFKHALHPPPPPVVITPTPVAPPPASGPASAAALEGQGMWIWYVSRSDGGNVPAIVAQAHAAGVSTLFIKSSDGSTNYWGQFSATFVQELHASGLRVCAWQYVYGSNPVGEAELGAEAVANGADCLVIDAEAEYEGRYGAAQTYLATLRAKVGPNYPLVLASFPYVSYHPSFPYSVFLGPGGAQFNAPQMYWKAIGDSVDTVYANTYIANRIYGRPIFPLGQTYEGVSSADLVRFREEATDYGSNGWSFWDWQETTERGWAALEAPTVALTSVTPNTTYPELSVGRKGDEVLWMQEHLAAAIATQETTGKLDAATELNLQSFQTAHGIPPSGVTDAATWAALLALTPVAVAWTAKGPLSSG